MTSFSWVWRFQYDVIIAVLSSIHILWPIVARFKKNSFIFKNWIRGGSDEKLLWLAFFLSSETLYSNYIWRMLAFSIIHKNQTALILRLKKQLLEKPSSFHIYPDLVLLSLLYKYLNILKFDILSLKTHSQSHKNKYSFSSSR